MKKIIGAICVPTIFTVLLNLLMLGNVYCNYQKYYNDLYLIGLMFLIFGHEAGGLLGLRQRIQPTPPALECSLNHWTAREVLQCSF